MPFATTQNPTAFGIFDAEVAFQNDADDMFTFVRARLGDGVVSVELPSKTVWTCFEEATLAWGRHINEYQAKSNLANMLGQATGTNVQNLYPRETLEFLIRQAQPYSMAGSYSGYQNEFSGSITLEGGRQDYNLRTELVDANGTPLFNLQPTGSQQPMRITEVFHFSPAVAYRFFDSTSAMNYLNNEFRFESFTPETIFYVLPVFEDLLRAGMLQFSQRVRRSNYYYKIVGQMIRIYPVPSRNTQNPRKLFIRAQFAADAFNLNSGTLGSGPDDSVNGISGLSNIPYGNIPYTSINSVGRQWIREYTLALCMITLAFIRGKVKSIPIPGNTDLQLNSDDLLTRGYELKEQLITQIRELLDSLTYSSLVEQEALKSENLMKQLRAVPMPNGSQISLG